MEKKRVKNKRNRVCLDDLVSSELEIFKVLVETT